MAKKVVYSEPYGYFPESIRRKAGIEAPKPARKPASKAKTAKGKK